MKKGKIILSISQPCSESWTKMCPTQIGSFCEVCQKDVMDFTELTDNEVINILMQSKGRICGRFLKTQIGRPMESEQLVKSSNPRYHKILAAALLLTATTPVFSQSVCDKPAQEQILPTKKGIKPNNNTIYNKKASKDNNAFIGTIYDKDYNQEPIIGVSIMIKNTNIGVLSDENGRFELIVPEEYMKKEKITFLLSSIGYETLSVTYNTDKIATTTEKTKFEIKSSEMILGEVVIIEKK